MRRVAHQPPAPGLKIALPRGLRPLAFALPVGLAALPGLLLAPGAWKAAALVAAFAAFGLLLRLLRTSGRSSLTARPAPVAGPGTAPDAEEALDRELELVRLATDAHEAALWRMSPDGRSAARIGWSALPGHEPGYGVVELEGHPFGWAVLEQVHVRLERGRRPLPTPWAQEMLLVPVDAPEGVLALAYPGGVPPGAEASALHAAAQLGTLLALLRTRQEAERTEEQVRALLDAVRVLPGELDPGRFAEQLADTVRRSVHAAGAAVAIWDAELSRGEVLRLSGEGPISAGAGSVFQEGESRAALAAKHEVALAYEDLRRERDALPLLARGERWRDDPRSAAVVPLTADGRTLGVVVAWDPLPGRLGEKETEFLRLLCGVAPLPLRSAREYQALDRRASTDALTGLPNRAAFEARFAATASHFERYERPFSVVMLDVDHFKRFNDTWGHEAGDRVLRHVAELIRVSLREVDLPARLGGEEFVAILPETALMPALEVAERLRRTIEGRPVIWNGRHLSVTVSLGVAACPDSLRDPSEILAAADAALYRSKGAGRNRTTAAPPAREQGAREQPVSRRRDK